MAAKTVSGAVAERDAKNDERKKNLTKVKDFLDRMQPEIARSLPAHLSAERMARIVYTQVRYSPTLAECSAESLAGAVLQCSQLGMEPGPTGEAWILPYWNKDTGSHEAQFQLGYKGMAKLYWQHPLAQYLDARTVHEGDEFDYAYGLDPVLVHKPARGERGKPIYWYAVAKLTNGGFRFTVLDKDDVERHRKRSPSPNSPAWRNDYNAMGCKSAVKEMFNLLPKAAEIERALARDDASGSVAAGEDLDVEPPGAIPGQAENVDEQPEPGQQQQQQPERPAADHACNICGVLGEHYEDECPGTQPGTGGSEEAGEENQDTEASHDQ